ncbi:MAG: DNRLRE domain-containing protein [Alphaproteobacteria bacterium]|nr:DNRLRE domain-containing protein [Alphaproteobacteria bacterium]
MRHYLATVAVGLFLFGTAQSASAEVLLRGPYLQTPTSSSMVLKWRTDVATNSIVNFGDAPTNLDSSASSGALTTEHEVTVTGLAPDTRYYYSIGSDGGPLSGGDSGHFFATSPTPGTTKPTRVWIIGDSGSANANAAAVRDAYKYNTGSTVTDLWLMLGDNAYPDGTDSEFQAAVFDTYPELLRKIPLWPTLGNHDGHSADSASQAGPYYDIFTLPTNGEAGGLASGTEAYYSFDYGNIHFVNLESYDTDRSPGGAMMTWLTNDLAANDKEWVIAFWHHPPYTKGSHDSDNESRLTDMRENALPILESYGVDLVLSGHSHSYERSHLLDGHYGTSDTLTGAMILDIGGGRETGAGAYDKPVDGTNAGAVYAVAGSSGKTSGGSLDHPAMFTSLNSLGSMILEINGNRLDAQFIDESGSVDDNFTIIKGPDTTPPSITKTEADTASTVTVTFSERVDAVSAETVANYTIDNSVTVLSASLAADERSVALDTSPLTEGVVHTLTVNSVEDLANNIIAANSQSQFTFVTIQTKEFQDGVAPTSAYAGTRDAYISQNATDTAFGTATTLLVDGDDPSGSNNDLSTLLLWDLSDIPTDALVDSATITINVTNVNSTPYEIYAVLVNWQETTTTWNNAATGTPWQSPGADGAVDRGATVLGAISSGVTGTHTVVLNQAGLDVVQSWIDGSPPNNGLIAANSSATNGLDFSSREAAGPLDRPKLSVTYSVPPIGPDIEAPKPPSGLAADAKTDTTVALSWQSCASASCDNVGVTGYRVYRDGLNVGSPTTPSFLDTGLTSSTNYNYYVISSDAAGNLSSPSPTLMVATDSASDPTVLVNDIAMSLQNAKKWRYARAQVTVLDGNAVPVPGVNVSVSWSGLTSTTENFDTDFEGTVTFDSEQVPKSASGDFDLAVTNLDHSGYIYDPAANVETSDCIDTGGADCNGDPGDPPGDPTITMKVFAIGMEAIASRKHWRAEAAVTIVDTVTGGVPLPGAMVIGDWTFQPASGPSVALGSTTAVTDSNGIARVLSPKRRANQNDMFLFEMIGATIVDGQFDSSGPSSASVPVL